MGGGPTSIDRSASESTPILQETFGATQRSALENLVQFGQPEVFTPDTGQISEDLRVATELANLRNRQFEEEQDPTLAAARVDLQDQVLGFLDFDQQLSDEFLKLGIGQSLAAGQPISGEAGAADTSILQNIFGRNFLQQLQQNLAFVGDFLSANPVQQVSLNPAQSVGLEQDALINALNTRNLLNQNLLTSTSQAGADRFDFGLNVNEALTREAGNISNIRNAARAPSFAEFITPIATAAAGSLAGPAGTAIGSQVGKAVTKSGPAAQIDTSGVSSRGIFSNPTRANRFVSSLDRLKF